MAAVVSTSRPARLLPYVALGAALGVAVREVPAALWPTPTQRWLAALVVAAVASFALGWALAVPARPRLLAVVAGWSGALCSISATTVFALSLTPVWGLSCMALVPLVAAAGVAVGAIMGFGRRERSRAPDGVPR